MKRRHFIEAVPLSLIAAPTALRNIVTITGQDGHRYELLRGNTGFFTMRGGTIGWHLGDEGIIVVDSQFPEQAGHFIDEVRKESQAAIEYLINTHHHGDHTAGNIAFRDLAAHVVAHENSKKNQMAVAAAQGTEDAQLYPGTTFAEQWSRPVGNEIITLQYRGRAHTDGDITVHFENADIVHMGDLIFNRRYPYIDMGAGASIANWIAVLDQCISYYSGDTIFIFGHAGNGFEVYGTKDDIRAFGDYLERLLEHVGKLIGQGIPEEEILQVSAIPGAPEWQGDGIQRSLRAALIELSNR